MELDNLPEGVKNLDVVLDKEQNTLTVEVQLTSSWGGEPNIKYYTSDVLTWLQSYDIILGEALKDPGEVNNLRYRGQKPMNSLKETWVWLIQSST